MPDHRFAARLAALAWAGLMCANGAAAPLPAPRVSTEQQFQLALEAQSAREYRAMLLWLRRAATAGDVQAQEMLGLALLVGPTLYGPAIKADRCEAGHWLARASAQGSEAARVSLDFLNRLRLAPSGQDVCQAWRGAPAPH